MPKQLFTTACGEPTLEQMLLTGAAAHGELQRRAARRKEKQRNPWVLAITCLPPSHCAWGGQRSQKGRQEAGHGKGGEKVLFQCLSLCFLLPQSVIKHLF